MVPAYPSNRLCIYVLGLFPYPKISHFVAHQSLWIHAKWNILLAYIKDDFENGAASVIRTRDLTLTKGALYRWSYGSTEQWFTLWCNGLQESLKRVLHLILRLDNGNVSRVY